MCIRDSIDEDAAPVVKRIFDLAIDGKGPEQIARILEKDKVLTTKAVSYTHLDVYKRQIMRHEAKEKQNAARDSNYREWQDIQGLLDKIRSTGMGGISADDPQAVQKLEKKLEGLEKSQETMKSVNAYYLSLIHI